MCTTQPLFKHFSVWSNDEHVFSRPVSLHPNEKTVTSNVTAKSLRQLWVSEKVSAHHTNTASIGVDSRIPSRISVCLQNKLKSTIFWPRFNFILFKAKKTNCKKCREPSVTSTPSHPEWTAGFPSAAATTRKRGNENIAVRLYERTALATLPRRASERDAQRKQPSFGWTSRTHSLQKEWTIHSESRSPSWEGKWL